MTPKKSHTRLLRAIIVTFLSNVPSLVGGLFVYFWVKIHFSVLAAHVFWNVARSEKIRIDSEVRLQSLDTNEEEVEPSEVQTKPKRTFNQFRSWNFRWPHRGLSRGCMSLGRLSAQGKRFPCRQQCRSTIKERNVVSWNMKRCNKSQCRHCMLCLIVPNPFQEVLHIFRIQAPNMMHMIMAFAPSTISVTQLVSRPKIQPQPAYYLFQT